MAPKKSVSKPKLNTNPESTLKPSKFDLDIATIKRIWKINDLNEAFANDVHWRRREKFAKYVVHRLRKLAELCPDLSTAMVVMHKARSHRSSKNGGKIRGYVPSAAHMRAVARSQGLEDGTEDVEMVESPDVEAGTDGTETVEKQDPSGNSTMFHNLVFRMA